MESRRQRAEGRRILVLIALIALFACETKEHANAELQALDKAKKAAAQASAHANLSATEEIGVPECDQYVKNYEACLSDKVPESRREELRQTLNEQRNRWRDAVTGGADQTQVAGQCKSAAAAAMRNLGDYGCSF